MTSVKILTSLKAFKVQIKASLAQKLRIDRLDIEKITDDLDSIERHLDICFIWIGHSLDYFIDETLSNTVSFELVLGFASFFLGIGRT